MGVLSKLNHPVFDNFEEISSIPRGTGNEQEISNFLVKFAKDLNLEVFQDDHLNVIIRKSSTNGNNETVILQGHMDMVTEKNADKKHNFLSDGIELKIKDEYIYADGTTLGADNGIAVAYAMAILASESISHPNLEVLITSGEEVGLSGANLLEKGLLKGNKLINIDSEKEGIFTVSCAGGARVSSKMKLSTEVALGNQLKIIVKGLNGGHSGMDIARNLSNSLKVLIKILNGFRFDNLDFNLVEISGGDKLNAIPREAYAVISINPIDRRLFEISSEKTKIEILKNLSEDDKNFNLTIKGAEEAESQLDMISTRNVLDFLTLHRNGVHMMNPKIPDMVLSSINLGKVELEGDSLLAESMIRSNSGSVKEDIIRELRILNDRFGNEFTINNSYPEWEYKSESRLREICIELYKEMYGKEPIISSIHAGLECGVLSEKIDNPDMISLGPDMFSVHTPEEHLDIKSTIRVYDYLVNLLSRIK